MKKYTTIKFQATFSLLVLISFSAFFSSCKQQKIVPNVIKPVSQVDYTSIFNGKNLDGWQVHGTEKWYVENGELVCESGVDAAYGYLSTKKYYNNFELLVDYKQEANGNSGIFFRSTVESTKVSGWQVEVAPPKHDSGGIYESYGRGWLIKPEPEKDEALKMGDWNTMKIRAVGPNVTTWLNGQEMVTLTDDIINAGKGAIVLQIHDGGGM